MRQKKTHCCGINEGFLRLSGNKQQEEIEVSHFTSSTTPTHCVGPQADGGWTILASWLSIILTTVWSAQSYCFVSLYMCVSMATAAFSISNGINKMNTVYHTDSFGLLLSSKAIAGVAGRPAQRKDLSCASLTGSGLNHPHPLLSRVKAKQSLLELHHQQLSHSWEGSPRSVSAEATESHTISFWSPARVSFSQSAASLVRAAFDVGERKVKENKEVFQAWWDQR